MGKDVKTGVKIGLTSVILGVIWGLKELNWL